MSEGQSINVAIRMRPLNKREVGDGQEERFQSVPGQNTIVQVNEEGEALATQAYTYDHVFDSEKTTEDVYGSMAQDLVDGVVEGINGTIFAYGQTSSGKTFTMLGADGANKGILELAAEAIFDKISKTDGRDFLLRVSFVEVSRHHAHHTPRPFVRASPNAQHSSFLHPHPHTKTTPPHHHHWAVSRSTTRSFVTC